MGQRTIHLHERWQRTLTVLRAPRVRIDAYCGDEARALHRLFTSRHPRFKVTAYKRWGVALIRLPDAFDDYLAGQPKKALRQNRRRADAAGFHFAIVSPQNHMDEILEINRSAPTRQGQPMNQSYLDGERVMQSFEGQTKLYGILDSDGRLRAYATMLVIGDAFVLRKLIGHADDLEHGIMYLLVSEIVRGCIDARRADGSPAWLMADTFWGATKGLAYFKERLGFRPFTVDWVWVDRD